MFTTPRTN